jgi:hypothetical protein
MAARLPAAAEKPRAGRVAKIFADRAQGGARNGFYDTVEFPGFRRAQVAGGTARMNSSLPKDFVRHPIADPGKAALQEQHGLDGGAGMPGEKCAHPRRGKFLRKQGGRAAIPPRGRLAPAAEEHAAKLARVAENKVARGLAQDQMVVPRGSERFGAGEDGAKLASHAEVKAEPGVPGKMKKHLLAVSLGTEQGGPGEDFPQGFGVGPAKDPFGGMKLDGHNSLSPAGVPLLSIEFNFGQFGHGEL